MWTSSPVRRAVAAIAMAAVLPLVALTQLGVTVALGVLLDTLVVRSILVPALTYELGDRVWWPWLRRLRGGEASRLDLAKLNEQLRATGQVTALGSVLSEIEQQYRSRRLAGVVLLSDFAQNSGPAPLAIGPRIRRKVDHKAERIQEKEKKKVHKS